MAGGINKKRAEEKALLPRAFDQLTQQQQLQGIKTETEKDTETEKANVVAVGPSALVN